MNDHAAPPPQLGRALASPDPEERRRAASQLGALAPGPAVPLVLAALGDEDWRVRKEATFAARELLPDAALLTALVGALSTADVGLCNAAVDVLGAAGAAATPYLDAALRTLDVDGRKLAVEALGRTRDRAALEPLGRALQEADPNIRQTAAESVAALAAVAPDVVEGLLLSVLGDADPIVRLAALSGLGALEAKIPFERLAPLLDDPALRPLALAAVARAGHAGAPVVLARALGASSGRTFDAALAAFAHVPLDPLPEEALAALRVHEPALSGRLAGVARSGGEEAVDRRRTALLVGAALGDPRMIDAAVEALGEPGLGGAALSALERLGAPAVEVLVARLEGDAADEAGDEARTLCVEALAHIALRSARPLRARRPRRGRGPRAGRGALPRGRRRGRARGGVRARVPGRAARGGGAHALGRDRQAGPQRALRVHRPRRARRGARAGRRRGAGAPLPVAGRDLGGRSDAVRRGRGARAGRRPRRGRGARHRARRRGAGGAAHRGPRPGQAGRGGRQRAAARGRARLRRSRSARRRRARRGRDALGGRAGAGAVGARVAAVVPRVVAPAGEPARQGGRAPAPGVGAPPRGRAREHVRGPGGRRRDRRAGRAAPGADRGAGPHRGDGARARAPRRRRRQDGDPQARERRRGGRRRGGGSGRRRAEPAGGRLGAPPRLPRARPRRDAPPRGRVHLRHRPDPRPGGPRRARPRRARRRRARRDRRRALGRPAPEERRGVAVIGKPDDLRLEVDEYRLLREIINRHSGIHFSIDARAILERKLRDRLVAQRFSSFGEYCQFLRSEEGKAELNEALDLVTVNETYFFREDYQLRCFQNEILPAVAREIGPKGRLSAWSAGCSTGEEVYTIAALVRESGLFSQGEVWIFGSDISRRCITAARRGVYGASSFRQTPPELKRRYFVERPDGVHVSDDLRAVCNFGQINLVNPERAAVVGRVQVIFCRNVLIYFDNASRRRVIEMFYERLVPGGYLLLGHAESLLNVSTAFELVHLREDLVYRKPVTMSGRSFA